MRPDIYLKIKEHNKFVEEKILETKMGSPISLTEILINKENIYKKIYEAK